MPQKLVYIIYISYSVHSAFFCILPFPLPLDRPGLSLAVRLRTGNSSLLYTYVLVDKPLGSNTGKVQREGMQISKKILFYVYILLYYNIVGDFHTLKDENYAWAPIKSLQRQDVKRKLNWHSVDFWSPVFQSIQKKYPSIFDDWKFAFTFKAAQKSWLHNHK